MSELVSQNDDLVRAKVKLELRAVELEEQKDRWEEERLDLKALVDTLKKNIEVTKSSLFRASSELFVYVRNLLHYSSPDQIIKE